MRAAWPIAMVSLVACRDEVPLRSGLDQPLRVEDGFFLPGRLPAVATGPVITSVESANAIVYLGQDGRTLGGRAQDDAYAIAVRFSSLGSGWWTHEVGARASLFPGERDFSLVYDIGGGIPPGLHALSIATIDRLGRRGPAVELDLCVLDDPEVGGLNPCDPSVPPPAAVIGLQWNPDVDLDLVVETPEGKRVSWKAPTTALPVDGEVPDAAIDDPSVGKLDRDSNAGCIGDGRNAESLVFAAPPMAGTWSIYVDMFDACGIPAATYVVSVYRRRMRSDGTMRLVETDRRSGSLIEAYDADGGANSPLFVLATELP